RRRRGDIMSSSVVVESRASPGRPLASIRHSSYLWTTVSALAPRDAERVLRFVADAEELADDHAFTPAVLEELGRLIPADDVTYCELDRVRKRGRLLVSRSTDDWDLDTPHLPSLHIAPHY